MKTNRKCEDNKGIPAPFRLPRLVFLDLDETLVPFQQLLSSTCPTEKKDATIIADAVLEKAEDFMYSSLEDVALLTLGERSLFPVSKLKECQLAMKRYEEDRHDPCESCISPSLERIDLLRDGMTKEAQALLDCLVTNNIKFYIVTASHICSALAKLRLFGLSQYVSARNVYHAIDFNKEDIFVALLRKERVPGSVCLSCGDGREEEHASAALDIPFIKIRSGKDICSVRKRLEELISQPATKKIREEKERSTLAHGE